MAGVVGFEPTVHATKKRCLTAWLHPSRYNLLTMDFTHVQGKNKFLYLICHYAVVLNNRL